MILVLLLVTATFRPSQPTVGDLVTIEFAKPVVLERSDAYEVVSQQGRRVVVRTFTPQPIALSGTAGNVRFRNLQIPVRSVLKPDDDLKPAPLRPPVSVPYARRPFVLIGVAFVLAGLLWWAVLVLAKRLVRPVELPIDPHERFRMAVASADRWGVLADATRAYLAATRPGLGLELTTTQLVTKLGDPVVDEILRQGDLDKFSPWGATSADVRGAAERALALIPAPVEETEGAA